METWTTKLVEQYEASVRFHIERKTPGSQSADYVAFHKRLLAELSSRRAV